MPSKKLYSLDQSPLYRLNSRSKLARLLGISLGELRSISAGDVLYKEFDIPKKNGGTRHVENPSYLLKISQGKIAKLLARIAPPDFLFCPVKGRCYVTNAAEHRDSRMVQCLDIRKFFPSTSQRRVFWFFDTVMQCSRDIAGLLSTLACFRGHLPTGSPLSPIMAYFAYFDLWQKIDFLCASRGHKLTIYVDDITISGPKVSKKDMWDIRQLIHGYGLEYHKAKTFVDRPAEVTGVILNRGQLFAPNRQHKKLREARANLSSVSIDARKALTDTIAGVNGQINQISKQN